MVFSAVLLIPFIINAILVSRTQGAAHFTVVPPSTLYVSAGETAKLVWDYTVDNKSEEFDVFSPRWLFYADNDNAFQIAQESIFKNQEWFINPATCPTRLLNPVRVSKESTATLVIHNVTLADSGTYGCVLVLAARSPITSKVKLVVTSYPIISLHLSPPSISMNASRPFFINCSVVGTPTPNVTWQTVRGKVIGQGLGKAIINITGIARKDSGIYKCCANNNPNKPAVCTITLISAQYIPEVQEINVNDTFSTDINVGNIILRCNASELSSRQYTWYDTSNGKISKALHNVTAGSVLELVTIDEDRYELHKCKAEAFHGNEEHFINVTQTVPTSKSTDTSLISPTNVAFSTREVHQVSTSPDHNSRTKISKKSCSILFYQDVTFATAHLIVTSISVAGNIIMAIYVYFMVKRAGLHETKKKSQRGSQQEYFAIKTDRMEIVEHETAVTDPPNEPPTDPIPPHLNNEEVSRKPEPIAANEMKQKENHDEQHFLFGCQHLYQQLSEGSYLSKEHEYQALQREKDKRGQPSKFPCEKEQGNGAANTNHQQQGVEYQELHLYSSLE